MANEKVSENKDLPVIAANVIAVAAVLSGMSVGSDRAVMFKAVEILEKAARLLRSWAERY